MAISLTTRDCVKQRSSVTLIVSTEIHPNILFRCEDYCFAFFLLESSVGPRGFEMVLNQLHDGFRCDSACIRGTTSWLGFGLGTFLECYCVDSTHHFDAGGSDEADYEESAQEEV